MHNLPFERFPIRNVRPFPIIELTHTIEEEVGLAMSHLSRFQIFNLKLPFPPLAIPLSAFDLMLEACKFVQLVFPSDIFPVFSNLLTRWINGRPFTIRFKRQLVRKCRDIARNTRIPMLIPCSAEVAVLLVYLNRYVFNSLGKSNRGDDPARASANDNYANLSSLIDGVFLAMEFSFRIHWMPKHFWWKLLCWFWAPARSD